MLIPDNLPQFIENETLIIVASTQAADLHIAYESEIKTVAEVRVESIKHDDHPGKIKRRSHGKDLGSSGLEANEDKKIKNQFHKKLNDALKNINVSKIDSVILFSSPQDKKSTKDHLPKDIQKKISLEINGNYVGDHPKDIIEHINKAS